MVSGVGAYAEASRTVPATAGEAPKRRSMKTFGVAETDIYLQDFVA
jgi:hypothetical protein